MCKTEAGLGTLRETQKALIKKTPPHHATWTDIPTGTTKATPLYGAELLLYNLAG